MNKKGQIEMNIFWFMTQRILEILDEEGVGYTKSQGDAVQGEVSIALAQGLSGDFDE